MRSLHRVPAAIALLAASSACGARTAAESDEGVQPANSEIAVEVENHNWSDIVIYLVRGGSFDRLGMVTSLSSVTFVFPFHRLGNTSNVRLRAYPIGGPGGFTSENLLVQPGQSIKWTLENDLRRSSLSVY